MRLANDFQENDAPVQKSPKTNSAALKDGKGTHENYHVADEISPDEIAQHLALAARATNDAVRHWDVKSGALSWPQGLQTLLGYKPSSISNEIGFWQRHLHPDDRPQVAASIRAALASATEHWSGEYRLRLPDGSYLLLLERALIVRDATGEPITFVGSLMDITARKQLQDQLCRSQKMEAFGQLAGGVAHDFNNFLTTILGYSTLLLDELAVKGTTAKHIGEIRKAAGRASALTSQLLAFSRKHPLDSRVLEVNALLTNLELSFLRLVGENIAIECDFQRAKSGVHIKADPGQLTQIIVNLVVNARDAMPDGGQLTLRTASITISEKLPGQTGVDAAAPGDYVTISVTDTGTGMSDEIKARLFEPFFTTKDRVLASGLGLATSYGIVRQSGGHILVESELGSGTTITIYLPKVSAPAAPSCKKAQMQKVPSGTETVLVVEDDIGVRHIAVRVLRGLGYHVIEAANGDDAQRFVTQEDDQEIHLLLTDVVMPHMSGRHFADWLRKTKPRTKVVFISGYLDESLTPSDWGTDGMYFLPKPFDPAQLALTVRQALDAKG